MPMYGHSTNFPDPIIGQDGNGNSRCGADQLVVHAVGRQLAHFKTTSPPCRGLELPDGILLRSTRSASLYFYLRTGVNDGKIQTQVFASNSPYDRQKTGIGSVVTPMFEPGADHNHLMQLEKLIRDWVEFVQEEPDSTRDFQSFRIGS